MKQKLYPHITGKNLNLLLFIFFFLTSFSAFTYAQNRGNLTGVVVDNTGEPITGATIMVKGTVNGTVTDIDGNFTLTVAEGNVLSVTYIGYTPQEITVRNMAAPLKITLIEDHLLLDEVVVVGYGTLEKKQVTSSISSVSSKDLVQGVGGATIGNALQGKVGGLIISGTASPNSSNTFQLRGVTSVKSGQTPLIVIDGMPGGDIRSVIQEDILSIDVLKDASAGAIYGTRAAAGVILITTKQGGDTKGKVRLNYNSEVTFKQVSKKPDILSAEEYRQYERGKDYGDSVNWYDEMLNPSPTSQKHVISLQGGQENANIYTTFMYENNRGMVIEDERTDYAGRINANFKLLDGWLEIKTHADYRQTMRNQEYPGMGQAMRNNPTRSPYDPDSQTGYNVWLNEQLDYNVIADAKLRTYQGMDKWFKPDVTLKVNIMDLPGLSVQQTFAYENRQWENHDYKSRYRRSELESNRTGEAYLGFDKTEYISSEGFVTYIHEFKKHSINAVAGYSYWQKNGEKFNMTNYNFTNDRVEFWNMGEGTYLNDGRAKMESKKNITEKLMAYFARANYSYDDKYMITATLRREGSSKFAKNNRWGTFWALSGGWRISREAFMEPFTFINDLKLRGGYGVTGNNDFDADYSAVLYSADQLWLLPGGNWAKAYGKARNVNDDLKWEEKTEWNVGLDFSLFKNRLYGKFDVYRRKVNDLIYEVQVPQPPYIEQMMFKNIGSLENRGWEFELGGTVVQSKDWNYSTNINISKNTTKLLTLDGTQTYMNSDGLPNPGDPGAPKRVEQNTIVGSYYMWKFAGFDEQGDFLLYDKDGKVIPASEKSPDDRYYIGNSMPTLILGWTHNVSYKNWDLTMNLRSWLNFDVYNTIDMYFGLQGSNSELNVLRKAFGEYNHIKGEKQLCDFFLEDGSFLKIDAISLAYNLNLKPYNKFVDNARFYLTIGNVATFTKYGGMNPEVDITGLFGGVENFDKREVLYPQTRTYALGMQLTF